MRSTCCQTLSTEEGLRHRGLRRGTLRLAERRCFMPAQIHSLSGTNTYRNGGRAFVSHMSASFSGDGTEKGEIATRPQAAAPLAPRPGARGRTPAPRARRRIRIPSPPAQGANFPPPQGASRSTWRRRRSRRARRSSPPCRSPWRRPRRLQRRTAPAPSRTPAPGSRPSRDARPRRSPFQPRRAMKTVHRAAPGRARAHVRMRPPGPSAAPGGPAR